MRATGDNCSVSHISNDQVDELSTEFMEAHAVMNDAVGGFVHGISTNSVAAMLEVLVDYALCGTEDLDGAEAFRALVERAISRQT